MSIETKKLVLIERLMQIKEEGILQQYEKLLKQAHLQYRAEESIKAIEDGQLISLNSFQSNNVEWLNNNLSTDERNSIITNEQKEAIDKGLNALENGDKIPHKQVMEQTKKRYPNLFK